MNDVNVPNENVILILRQIASLVRAHDDQTHPECTIQGEYGQPNYVLYVIGLRVAKSGQLWNLLNRDFTSLDPQHHLTCIQDYIGRLAVNMPRAS